MSRREPNPLTARRLPFKPFVGVADLSQEREVTAKDLLRTRRKKKGKRAKKKKKKTAAPARASHQIMATPASSFAAALWVADEREVTASDILKRRPRKR